MSICIIFYAYITYLYEGSAVVGFNIIFAIYLALVIHPHFPSSALLSPTQQPRFPSTDEWVIKI